MRPRFGLTLSRQQQKKMAAHGEELKIEKLKNAETYQMWKFQIDILLKSKGLFEYTEVGCKCESTDKKKISEWQTADAKVQNYIVTTVEKTVLVHLMNCKSGSAMYKKLQDLFERDSSQQKCLLLTNFYKFKFDAKKNVADNIAALETIAFRLKTLEEVISDEMLIAKVLSELPEQFKHFVSAWESTQKEERTLTNLVARLSAEEATNNDKTTVQEVSFRASSSSNRNSNVKCFNCNKFGHYARNCKTEKLKPCRICKKTNHAEEKCFFRKKNDGPGEAKVAFFTNGHAHGRSTWIVDSGASAHMTNDVKILENVKKQVTPFTVANDSKMSSEAIGKVNGEKCSLEEVAFVPDLLSNLLSVNRVTENGGTVVFGKSDVVIKYKGKEVLKGKKNSNGLYVVDVKTGSNAVLNVQEWHRKMGHLGLKNLNALKSLSEGMNFDANCKIDCDVCIRAKQTRTPFSGELPKATRALEILHTDVCGPIETETYDGKKYYVTILDDFTHYSEVHLAKNKSEASNIVKEFILRAENKKNEKVASIKSDNGLEYESLRQWCKQKGIQTDVTTVYTPQNNGKAERLNRTLCEKMRALLFDSGLPKSMWGEAVQVACYLTNRSPTRACNVTPYEMWTGSKPDLKKLKIFGCDAYAKVLTYTKKLDERSVKMTFVGYAPNGYRLWNAEKQKICISRDVKFVEEKVSELKTNCETENCVSLELSSDDEISEDVDVEEAENSESEQVETPDGSGGLDDSDPGSGEEKLASVGPDDSSPAALRPRDQLRKPEYYHDYHLNVTDVLGQTMLTFEDAVCGSEKSKWLDAIDEEKKSLVENGTWKYVDVNEAKGRKILSTRWVFKIKDNGKYRARLVVRGFEQVQGVDFKECYSPVVNVTSLRVLMAVAASKNFACKVFDVKTAFLNGELDEEVFIHIPEGFAKKRGKICKLEKSLYGLRQAPLMWNNTLKRALAELGMQPLKTDPCIFKNKDNSIYLAMHVDDGMLVGKNQSDLEQMLQKLDKFFCITSNEPKSYIGIELKFDDEGIHLSQGSYAKEVVSQYKMNDAKIADTPICINNERKDEVLNSKFPYRETVGSLLYLSSKTRPDISFSVNFLARSCENPTETDIQNVKRTLRYLKGTSSLGLSYKANGKIDTLTVYSDSDYAGDKKSGRSTTGYVCYFNGAPIAWCSRRQPVVALSSTEAEFIAAAESVKEVIFLKNLIEEVSSEQLNIELRVDNTSAMSLIKTGKFNMRSKHINVRYFFLSEKYNEKLFEMSYCPSSDQIADVMTKPLTVAKFTKFRDEMVSDCK